MKMSELSAQHIDAALASKKPYYLIELIQTKGSTPRDAGALMIVGQDEIFGTIGGGSAEWVAVQTAREFIKGEEFFDHQTITLGPQIDQCCGGSLEITYHLVDEEIRSRATGFTKSKSAIEVLIFGAAEGSSLQHARECWPRDRCRWGSSWCRGCRRRRCLFCPGPVYHRRH